MVYWIWSGKQATIQTAEAEKKYSKSTFSSLAFHNEDARFKTEYLPEDDITFLLNETNRLRKKAKLINKDFNKVKQLSSVS